MCRHLTEFLKKYRSVIIYLVFGVLTTLVNYFVYYPLYNVVKFSAAASNGISWLVAVIFAFFTNKSYVFKSKSWDKNVVVPEFIKFVGCRTLSGVAETAILYVVVDVLSGDGNLLKILTSILVIVFNYIAGKFLVFKNRKGAVK